MKHNFIALICFLLILSGFQAASISLPVPNRTPRLAKSRLLEAVTQNGQITLQKDSTGFFVSVDFVYNPTDASDSDAYDPYLASMSLGLYTSETLLTQSCLQFDAYVCSSYSCSAYTYMTANRYFPYFQAQGYHSSSGVYLDYSNWELANFATIATNCVGNTYNPYGSGRFGIIGLGFNTTSPNFINSQIFSIFLERDGSSGTFLFESNSNVTSVSQQSAVWTADSNWHIDASDSTVEIGDTSMTFSSKVIFDVDADAIGFPSSMYQSLLDNFQAANSKVSCSSDTYQPTCSYDGKIRHLKNIKLIIQGYKVHIPPSVYIQGISDDDHEEGRIDGSFTLNIKSLDPTLQDKSYVTEEYQNYIILDQNFMSYYYAEFSANNGSYTVTLATQYRIPDDSLPVWAIIIIAIVGFVILSLIVCCICGCVKRRRYRRRSTARKIHQTGSLNSSRESHFANDQPANNAQYPPQNNYYYPPPPAYNYGYDQNVHSGYTQQYQNAPNNYGNMPGYTYIPQTGAYPYLPPAPGQVQGTEHNAIHQNDNLKAE